MGKFIVGTFLLLGWGFYVMSGGSDFKPEAWSDQVAKMDTQEIEQTIDVTRNNTATLNAVAPEAVETPVATEVATVVEPLPTISIEPAPVAATPSLDLRAVAGSRVNMREGPGTNYGVIETLSNGTEAEVIEVNAEGWARIRLVGTNQTGWMAERLLNPI